MSKIEVNTVDTQCGTNLTVGAACKSVTVAGNDVRSNAYKAADGGNIASQSGTTITLGASGDTITLASGATQSGFGRTGTVDWQTSSIKTSTFTAANGEGYFANTSGGAFTMNLPAGTAGNIVSVVDYTNTFQTNNLTITPNGSQKIGGIAASQALSTEGQSVTFVYVDDTEGWKNVQDSTSNVVGNPFLVATGGTITTSGNCKIHTFTGPGTFTVCSVSTNCAAENVVSYMVIAGGGGGGANRGGGGGAGGYREVKTPITPYTASGLNGYPSAPNRVTVTAQAYPIAVGAGGNGAVYPEIAPSGSVSTFSTISSAGGGGGGGAFTSCGNGASGGSGGGGAGYDTTSSAGAAGNVPSVSPPQGNGGGNGAPQQPGGSGGGGGGAAASGSNASGNNGGNGGGGTTTEISGSPVTRAGGGGGGPWNSGTTSGGPGGGGGGVQTTPNTAANPGTANTGGGGGAGYWGGGGNGGSGIVIIRYKFQ